MPTPTLFSRGYRNLPTIDFPYARTHEERQLVWDSQFVELCFKPMLLVNNTYTPLSVTVVRVLYQLNSVLINDPEYDCPSIRMMSMNLHDSCGFRHGLTNYIEKFANRRVSKEVKMLTTERTVSVGRVESFQKVHSNCRPWTANSDDLEGQLTFDHLYQQAEWNK